MSPMARKDEPKSSSEKGTFLFQLRAEPRDLQGLKRVRFGTLRNNERKSNHNEGADEKSLPSWRKNLHGDLDSYLLSEVEQ